MVRVKVRVSSRYNFRFDMTLIWTNHQSEISDITLGFWYRLFDYLFRIAEYEEPVVERQGKVFIGAEVYRMKVVQFRPCFLQLCDACLRSGRSIRTNKSIDLFHPIVRPVPSCLFLHCFRGGDVTHTC